MFRFSLLLVLHEVKYIVPIMALILGCVAFGEQAMARGLDIIMALRTKITIEHKVHSQTWEHKRPSQIHGREISGRGTC